MDSISVLKAQYVLFNAGYPFEEVEDMTNEEVIERSRSLRPWEF